MATLGAEYGVGVKRLRAATRDPVHTLRSVPRGKRGVMSCDAWFEEWVESQVIQVERAVTDWARRAAEKMRNQGVGKGRGETG